MQSILFIVDGNNELDHAAPVIYKLSTRENVSVTVSVSSSITKNDYRIDLLRTTPNIDLQWHHQGIKQKISSSFPPRVVGLLSFLYHSRLGDAVTSVLDLFGDSSDESMDEFPHSVVAYDWSYSKRSEAVQLGHSDEVATIVLPHGDSPFINNIENNNQWDRFLKRLADESSYQPVIGYDEHPRMLPHDYLLFPNELTADRVRQFGAEEHVYELGSPRYNPEWLARLDTVRPPNAPSMSAELNVLLFLRHENYFINKKDVENTISMLEKIRDIGVVMKEHPRKQLLDPSVTDGMETVERIRNEYPSISLIDWADVVLSLGTTITFEPVMKRKPVLALEYAHGNYTTVAHYFSNAEMRTKEDLYHTIYELLENGTDGFYDDAEHERFVREMITAGNDSVLDNWAEFIERVVLESDEG